MGKEKQNQISEAAKKFIKREKRALIEKFANLEKYPSVKLPFSFFMAGSPGAGKTEFSKGLVETMKPTPIVRIDADDIREFIPQYNGRNSNLVQGAAAIAVDNLNYYTLKHNQNSIIDGTFANYEIAHRNILNCLNKNRRIGVFYLYQDPLIAWSFTKKREKLEGRHVPRESFIEAFFKSKENSALIKKEFGNKIELNLVIKNRENSIEKIEYNVSHNIDDFIKITYNRDSLREKIC